MARDSLAIAMIAFLSSLSGCQPFQSKHHKAWHDHLHPMFECVLRQQSESATVIARTQLFDELGEPDLTVTPNEIVSYFGTEADASVERLWKNYSGVKRNLKSGDSGGNKGDDWRKCASFLACELVCYDESYHFKKPYLWGWGTNTGFSCFVFYVEDHQVVGTIILHHFKPLRKTVEKH